uniref:CUB_2 domain-containing protein n=1 Tax=Panagrellus redivivus TaxID=6233 RepID=A0A7E4VNN6_PANRE
MMGRLILPLLSVFVTGVIGIETITLGPDTNLNLPENDYIIQSPNFPNSYGTVINHNNVGQIILNAPAEEGAGYYLFFTEFMIDETETIIISHENTTHILSGSEFTKRGTAAYIYTEGNVVFQIGANSLSEDDHTGFQIIAKRHGVNEIVGTSYNDSTNLDELDYAYFFVSPAYPAVNGSTIERTQTFMSNNSIRVLLYDFDFNGTVVLSGTDVNGTDVKIEYTGFQTNTSTVANYFLHDVTIDVKCKRPAGCGRYFVIVEPYVPKPPTITSLNFSLDTNVSQWFTSVDYDRTAYPNNYQFYVNITAPENTEQKIVLWLKFESEASSDGMSFTGLVANPAADNWRLTGSWYTLLFAETNHLQLSFSSDGVGRAVGFYGSLYLQSCKCPEDEVLETNYTSSLDFTITSPGYSNRDVGSYCPGLNCQWSYKFTVDHIFNFDSPFFEFRDSDFLRISDDHNKTIAIFSNSNKANTSSFYVNSGIVHFQFVTSSDIVAPNGTDNFYFWMRAGISEVFPSHQPQFIDRVTFVESYFVSYDLS